MPLPTELSWDSLGGVCTGYAVAGPVGAIVGGAATSRFGDVLKVGMSAATLAYYVATGPVGALTAGALAAGGSYVYHLPREEKVQLAFAVGEHAVTYGHQAAVATMATCSLVARWSTRMASRRLTVTHHIPEDTENASIADVRTYRAVRAELALEEHGCALHPIDEAHDGDEWRALSAFLETDHGSRLGHGRDHKGGTRRYNVLRLAAAWRIDNPAARGKYKAAREAVAQQMGALKRKDLVGGARGSSSGSSPGLPTLTADAARAPCLWREEEEAAAAPPAPPPPSAEANETLLLHGTKPDVLLPILSNGLNERYSGSSAGAAYGEGSYLAEDVAKSDQYSTIDSYYDAASELHRRLYGRYYRHPGDVFYVLVCRTCLGHPAITEESGKSACLHHRRAALPAHLPRARFRPGRAGHPIPLSRGGVPRAPVPRVCPLPQRPRPARLSARLQALPRRKRRVESCTRLNAEWEGP